MQMRMVCNDCTKDTVLSENPVGAFERFRTYHVFGTEYQLSYWLIMVKTREVNASFVEGVRPLSYSPRIFVLDAGETIKS